MQWGDSIKMLKEMQEQTGIVPRALEERPVLNDRLTFFYKLFNEVTSERDYDAAGGPLPLKLSSFKTYCEVWGWEPDEMRWAWPILTIFDEVWRTEMRKKMQSKESK